MISAGTVSSMCFAIEIRLRAIVHVAVRLAHDRLHRLQRFAERLDFRHRVQVVVALVLVRVVPPLLEIAAMRAEVVERRDVRQLSERAGTVFAGSGELIA